MNQSKGQDLFQAIKIQNGSLPSEKRNHEDNPLVSQTDHTDLMRYQKPVIQNSLARRSRILEDKARARRRTYLPRSWSWDENMERRQLIWKSPPQSQHDLDSFSLALVFQERSQTGNTTMSPRGQQLSAGELGSETLVPRKIACPFRQERGAGCGLEPKYPPFRSPPRFLLTF